MSAALALTFLLGLIAGSGARPAAGAQPCSRRDLCRRQLAQADAATPEVVTANVGHSENISGASNINPQAWPVPPGFRPVQRQVMRMVGRGVVQRRLQMEAGWRTYVEEVTEVLGGAEFATYRHINFTEHPSTRADLAALESVDEEVVLYVRSNADPLLFANGNATARAAAEAGLMRRIHARGLDVQLLQLYVGPLVGASRPQARPTHNITFAATRSKLLISGSGLLPPRVGLQTAVLLALRSAATGAALPLLSCNVTSWQLASAADANRLNMTVMGLVEADMWTQTPGDDFQPSAFWQKVVPRMEDTTEAAGVPMRVWFVSAATIYMTENGTEVGSSTDLATAGDAASAPGPSAQGNGEHVTVKVVAIIGVLSAGVVLVASLIALTIWLCLRRRRRQQQQRKALRDAHAPNCPMHVCTCHAAKARPASPRALQGGTYSGPLPVAMLLHADARPHGSVGSSSGGSPGANSPADSGGAYGALRQAMGAGCGAGCKVHALLDAKPNDAGAGFGVLPAEKPTASSSGNGSAGTAVHGAVSGDSGRPPRVPGHAGGGRGGESSSGGCCCVGAAAVSDSPLSGSGPVPDAPCPDGGSGGPGASK